MGNWARPAGLLLGTALLAVLLNSDFLLFVLGLEVLLLPAACWTAARLAKKVRVRVVIPESRVFQGETFQIQAELENQSILPVAQASVRLAVRAYPEREALLLTGKLFLNGGERGSLCFRLEGSHCTSLEIQPDRLTITDPWAFFSAAARWTAGKAEWYSSCPAYCGRRRSCRRGRESCCLPTGTRNGGGSIPRTLLSFGRFKAATL